MLVRRNFQNELVLAFIENAEMGKVGWDIAVVDFVGPRLSFQVNSSIFVKAKFFALQGFDDH